MYAIERKRIIKEYLKEHNQAQVQELSGILGVSEVTVRRDLERLEAEGWLTRTHGGAVINRPDTPDPIIDLIDRTDEDESSERIASVAIKMIQDGEVVMLTNGPVNAVIASKLGERSGLTVLTNDVEIALRITLQKSNRVVLLGGDMNRSELAVFGTMALTNLQKFYVSHLFIEVDGINEDLLLTVNNQDKADLILGALELADKATVICPSDRFGRNAFFRLGNLKMIRRIISNSDITERFKERIFSNNIALFTTIAAFEGAHE